MCNCAFTARGIHYHLKMSEITTVGKSNTEIDVQNTFSAEIKKHCFSLMTLNFNALCFDECVLVSLHSISRFGRTQGSPAPSVRRAIIRCGNWIQDPLKGIRMGLPSWVVFLNEF